MGLLEEALENTAELVQTGLCWQRDLGIGGLNGTVLAIMYSSIELDTHNRTGITNSGFKCLLWQDLCANVLQISPDQRCFILDSLHLLQH